MAMSLEQLKQQLSDIKPSENTYRGITAAELPLLEQILHGPDNLLGTRAVFALSRLRDARALDLLQRAAKDVRSELRVAAAASAMNLPPAERSRMLQPLLGDTNMGVRKFALHAADGLSDPTLTEHLKAIESRDPVPALRKLATEKIKMLR
jgi:HEAT repeat protein